MKITIAMDSFKGSMTSLQAGNAVKNGILKVCEQADVNVIPVADGGEGTVEALTYGREAVKHNVTVTGPLGKPVQAEYIIVDGETAIIEMAQAAGLTLVPVENRNPLHTTTYGVGELIIHAIEQGCRRFIVGIGGSATNDCGIGMLQALGYEFVYGGDNSDKLADVTMDNASENVMFGAIALQNITQILGCRVNPILKDCQFTIACDVDNPLVGEKGCSHIFAPQKGATLKMVEDMDNWINHFADVVEDYVNHTNINRHTQGAGAAGGLGYAFLMFLGGKLMSGAQIVIANNHLEEKIIGSDFVITGEGKLDSQSSMGKLPTQIAWLAKKHGKKVIAIAGQVDTDFRDSEKLFYKVIQIDRGDMTINHAMETENAVANLERTIIQSFDDN